MHKYWHFHWTLGWVNSTPWTQQKNTVFFGQLSFLPGESSNCNTSFILYLKLCFYLYPKHYAFQLQYIWVFTLDRKRPTEMHFTKMTRDIFFNSLFWVCIFLAFHVIDSLAEELDIYNGLKFWSVNCVFLGIQQELNQLSPGVFLCKYLQQGLTPVMKNISPLHSRLSSTAVSVVTAVCALLHSWQLGCSLKPESGKRSLRYVFRMQEILSSIWNKSRFLWSLG